jgi:hypothetical protein
MLNAFRNLTNSNIKRTPIGHHHILPVHTFEVNAENVMDANFFFKFFFCK